MCAECDEIQETLDKVQETLGKVIDALCPNVLGNDLAFYRQVAERQGNIFNEYVLEQALNRRAAQAIMIMYTRYMDALAALNGNGGGDA